MDVRARREDRRGKRGKMEAHSVVVCLTCGAKNRVLPGRPGIPECGNCGSALPVPALDEPFFTDSPAPSGRQWQSSSSSRLRNSMLVAVALGLAGIFGWYAANGGVGLDKLTTLFAGRPNVKGTTADVRYTKSSDVMAWVAQRKLYVVDRPLPQFSTVHVLRTAPYNPKFVVGRLTDGTEVTLKADDLEPGDGLQARQQAQVKAQAEEQAQEEAHAKFLRCQQQAGETPRNNETLRQLNSGLNQITVTNSADDDAVASFRGVGGMVAMSIFVAANSTATIFDFPDGRYRLEFSLGREWSWPCHFFLRGNQTQMFPKYDNFTASSGSFYQAKYTIPPVPGSNIAAIPLDADEFESWDR